MATVPTTTCDAVCRLQAVATGLNANRWILWDPKVSMIRKVGTFLRVLQHHTEPYTAMLYAVCTELTVDRCCNSTVLNGRPGAFWKLTSLKHLQPPYTLRQKNCVWKALALGLWRLLRMIIGCWWSLRFFHFVWWMVVAFKKSLCWLAP